MSPTTLTISTALGQATLRLLGLSASGGSTQSSLTVNEGAGRRVNVMGQFRGLDGNDQISATEAIPLGVVNGSVTSTSQLDHMVDVDMYAFQVVSGQRVAFDIDTPENGNPGLGSYLRLFDGDGTQLAANNDAKAPDEPRVGFDAYFAYTFETEGTYYIAVGNWLNTAFDPQTGHDSGSGTVWTTGRYTLTLSDPDDQIVEAQADAAQSLGALDIERIANGLLDTQRDVDTFSFTVQRGQKVAFDIDLPSRSGVTPRLTLFDAGGQQLATNVSAPAPREDGSSLPYFEYTFDAAGTYFISVSGQENSSFSVVTGESDTDGQSPPGTWTLALTPITRTLSRTSSRITGEVWMPNAIADGVPDHRQWIQPFLRTVGNQSIRGGVPTWLVVHGRIDSSDSFAVLADRLERYQPGDQVLLLDWREAAADNPRVLDGAEWIPYIADWAAGILMDLAIPASRRYFVGHSWGSYLSYELATRTNGVQALVALDPAQTAIGYAAERINFRAVSNLAWVFYGNGIYGSASLSATADESFATEYQRSNNPPAALSVGDRHSTPIRVFEYLVANNRNTAIPRVQLFSLTRLTGASQSTAWRFDTVDGAFEGRFRVSADASGVWNRVERFQYTRPDGRVVNV